MRTIVMPERALGLAWLEHFPEEGGPPERTNLDRFPFVIGRSENAHLQVTSGRVSREHAVLVSEDREYRIRDLNSTNGTFVNGRRIHETVLHHGDLLVIGNVEFAFGCGQPECSSRTVTQVIGFESPDELGPCGADLRHEVRRLHEVLLRGCLRNAYDPIVDLGHGRLFAFEARSADDPDLPTHAPPAPLAASVRHLRRRVAAEESRRFPGEPRLFLGIESCELATPWLAESIGALRSLLAGGRQLVVVLPCEAISDSTRAECLLQTLRDMGIGLGLEGLAGKALERPAPAVAQFDFVKLAPELTRGIHGPHNQQLVQSAVRAASDGGWQVIATGIRSKAERNVCDGLGCALGQGPLFAEMSPEGARTRPVARPLELSP